MDVLPYALVLDFVFSDSALQAWDNNGQQVCKGLAHPDVLPKPGSLQTLRPGTALEASSSSG